MGPLPARGASLALAAGLAVAATTPALAGGSLSDAVAAVRARGNDKPEAMRIGRNLFQITWPVQVTKIRVDVAGRHRVAGLVLSGLKFHTPVTPERFTDEVIELVRRTFAASTVEEVDVWVILPLPTRAHEIVAGDLAHPSSYTVYAVTVRRTERETFAARLQRGDDVYWQPAWRATLTGR
ncbi:MAG: hypothetical protein NVSMB19_05270 [Vulcanimicrobiaceae bacterium]